MPTRPSSKYRMIPPKEDRTSILGSFLRSVGLKILTLHERFSGVSLRDGKEQEQIVVSNSRKIALSRIAVHVLPVLITLLVFGMNAIEILNGPQISVPSTFFLQVAAKLHELSITGSVTVVVLDIVRYELLHGGLNLGLLASGYTMTGISFLWSPEMLSMFKADYAALKKTWLLFAMATCCIVLAVVGPASALLFVPIQVWKPSGGTDFYLGSTSDDLWPNRLTALHAGPLACRELGSMTMAICPAGGFEMVAARILKDPQVGYTVFLQDAHFTRVITGSVPRFNASWHRQNTQESWVTASRGDVSFMMQDLLNKYHDAQMESKGRDRRLRDFVDGSYMITESRIPVGRTVCGPAQLISDGTKTIPLPVLEPDRTWRNISSDSSQEWGKLAYHEIDDLLQVSADRKGSQAFARWIALGPEHKAATAGLVVLSQSLDYTVGRGCTLDFRWALGQTYHGSGTSSEVFAVHVGRANTPSDSRNSYAPPAYRDFLDPEMVKSYGDTIKADQAWLDAVFPTGVVSDRPTDYNMTTFEAMINRTRVQDPSLVSSNESSLAFLTLTTLEYITSVSFIDVLARTNWHKSLQYPDNSMMINPVLQQCLPNCSQSLLTNGQVFTKPDNISTTTLHVNWYAYGTVWTLDEPGQWIAVAVLSLYILIALTHSIVTLVRGTSMDAWDSILELILLAWNSTPTRRDHEFKNASVGVHRLETVTHKVKVVVVGKKRRVCAHGGDDGESDDSSNNADKHDGRVELVLVDPDTNSVDGRATESVLPGELYR